MGDRANIIICEEQGSKIHLYTHWGGSELRNTLAAALDRGRDRWTDESYLTRIIFSEMVRNDINGTTGFGISTRHCEPGNDIEIRMSHEMVYDCVTDKIFSFDEFIKKYL